MRSLIIFAFSLLMMHFLNGCATWEGVKYDSKKAWKSTKKTIHEATAE